MTRLCALVLALLGFGLAACNTVKGVGRDTQAVGDSIEEAADEAEDDIND